MRSKMSSQLYMLMRIGNNFKVNSRFTVNIILKCAVKDDSPVLGQLLPRHPWKVCPVVCRMEWKQLTWYHMVTSFDSLKMPPLFFCPKFSTIPDRALSSLKRHLEINAVKNQYNCNLMPGKLELAASECAVELTGRSIPQVVQVVRYIWAS